MGHIRVAWRETEAAMEQETTKISVSKHDQLMQIVQEELNKFEAREAQFRKQNRRERAAALNLPLRVD